VNTRRNLWRLGGRLAVCGLLLAWIFQTICWDEGKQAWGEQRHDRAWAQLTRGERLAAAWTYGPPQLGRMLVQVKPGAFIASLGFMGLTVFLGILRWRMVLRVQGLNLPFRRAAEISLVAHFFNSFLLGSTGGDLLKAYYAARETHHKKTEAVTTVFVDRLLGLFTMLLFAVLMMVPNLTLLFTHRRLGAIAGFILLMAAAGGVVVWLAFWGGLSRRLPRAREWLRKIPKGELVEQSLAACREFGRQPGFLLRAMGLSMALNLACVLQVWTLSVGLGLSISPVALSVIVPTIICISALPITPSGLGVRENLYVLMLATPEIHVAATSALSLSLLAYAGSLLWSLAGGAVYLGLKDSQHLAEVTAAE